MSSVATCQGLRLSDELLEGRIVELGTLCKRQLGHSQSQEVVGISLQSAHPPLALQLARPLLLLAALSLYRFLFAVGTLAVRTRMFIESGRSNTLNVLS